MLLGRAVSQVLLVSLAASSAGCSFIFVRPPPSVDAGTIDSGSRRCTTSKVAPVLDTLFTGLQGARIVYAATASDKTYSESQPISRSTDIALGITMAAVFLSSAVYGYVTTAKCSELNQRPGLVVQKPQKDARGAEESTDEWGSGEPSRAPDPNTRMPRQ